ncbi:TMV resistance protein N [Morella rubra]|uniref:TMV resistance protein N n=1 Tax=Morella rubra TaxID=262757 RepID=A0A6A1WPD0_9ROSI|nr:TMV resistance protein N [Morella rubra]
MQNVASSFTSRRLNFHHLGDLKKAYTKYRTAPNNSKDWQHHKDNKMTQLPKPPNELSLCNVRIACISKSLSNLKGIDLRWSEHLIEIPDLTGAPNLERLNLEGCKNLSKVHPDIGVHKRLKELILSDCKSLESLPEEINLESVKVINLRYCSRLKKFPDIVGNMTSLEHLLLDGTAINRTTIFIKEWYGVLEVERFIDEHEGFEGKSRGDELILGSIVAHGMPDWFNTRSSGSSVTLEMHQNLGGMRSCVYACNCHHLVVPVHLLGLGGSRGFSEK